MSTTLPRPRAWLLCGLLFCATALSFMDRQVLSVLAPQVTGEFGMSNAAYSRVVFAFVLSYTVMFSIGGRVLDVLGTQLGLAIAVAVWSAASAAHALVQGPWGLGAARFVLGIGEGACFPAATKGALEWMPPPQRALAVGLANGGSAFGAVLAPPLTALWTPVFGWRGVFVATGLFGGLWLIAWHLAFRGLDTAAAGVAGAPGGAAAIGAPGESAADRAGAGLRARTGFRALLARPDVRRLVAARFCFDPVFYFYMFWIPQYLARERGLSLAQIGSLTWIPFLALGLTTIAAGRLSDVLVQRGWPPRRARLTLMLIAALLTPASGLAALSATTGLAIGLMSVLMVAHGIWIANFITLIGDTVDTEEVGTAVGLTGTSGGIAGMLSSLAIGPIVDQFSFTPVFVGSAVLYPIAWLVIAAGVRHLGVRPTAGSMKGVR